jgi:hypothetical protein
LKINIGKKYFACDRKTKGKKNILHCTAKRVKIEKIEKPPFSRNAELSGFGKDRSILEILSKFKSKKLLYMGHIIFAQI